MILKHFFLLIPYRPCGVCDVEYKIYSFFQILIRWSSNQIKKYKLSVIYFL